MERCESTLELIHRIQSRVRPMINEGSDDFVASAFRSPPHCRSALVNSAIDVMIEVVKEVRHIGSQSVPRGNVERVYLAEANIVLVPVQHKQSFASVTVGKVIQGLVQSVLFPERHCSLYVNVPVANSIREKDVTELRRNSSIGINPWHCFRRILNIRDLNRIVAAIASLSSIIQFLVKIPLIGTLLVGILWDIGLIETP